MAQVAGGAGRAAPRAGSFAALLLGSLAAGVGLAGVVAAIAIATIGTERPGMLDLIAVAGVLATILTIAGTVWNAAPVVATLILLGFADVGVRYWLAARREPGCATASRRTASAWDGRSESPTN